MLQSNMVTLSSFSGGRNDHLHVVANVMCMHTIIIIIKLSFTMTIYDAMGRAHHGSSSYESSAPNMAIDHSLTSSHDVVVSSLPFST